MNGYSFQQVLWQNLSWRFSENWKTLFVRGFILKPIQRAQILLRNGTRDFANSPPFVSQSVEMFNVFNTLTSKQIFWKTHTFLKQLEYCFLVESTKIESASFPYKTAMSEVNVKKNRIKSTKWTCRNFASNYFIFFLKILFQFKNLL